MNSRAPSPSRQPCRSQVDCDVLIVGAGPAGSSAATFLAREGRSCLLLERARFPRDKVCGDGLAPQALYWLEQLGCADEVLRHAHCCLTGCELYIDGRFLLFGRYPPGTRYPTFWTLVPRKELDYVLVQHAVKQGASLIESCAVRKICVGDGRVEVHAERDGATERFTAKLLIGADGAGSVVSRFLGNAPQRAIRAVSMRTYYQGLRYRGRAALYFSEPFFPGYGWCFADDRGLANVGVGYAWDPVFRHRLDLRQVFEGFINTELRDTLRGAVAAGPPVGGWASFGRPARRVEDRVILIGDAGQCGDPLNGGGIHKAFESAALAARVAAPALAAGDCSCDALKGYERLIEAGGGVDAQMGELVLALAKNPHFRLLYLQFLEQIGVLLKEDPRFTEFCSGIFSGMLPRSQCFSPWTLLGVLPRRPERWLNLVCGNRFLNGVSLAAGLARGLAGATRGLLTHPADHAAWVLELGVKAAGLGDRLARTPASLLFPTALEAEHGPRGKTRSLTSTMEGGRYGYQPVRPVQQGY